MLSVGRAAGASSKAPLQVVTLAARVALRDGLMGVRVTVLAPHGRDMGAVQLLFAPQASIGFHRRRRIGESRSTFVLPRRDRIRGHGLNAALFAVLTSSSAARAALASALARTGASWASMFTAVACAVRARSARGTDVMTRPKPRPYVN